MKIYQAFTFLCLATLLSFSLENKGGYYSYDEIQNMIASFDSACNPKITSKRIIIGNSNGKKVLIFGGFHGSLVTAAQVLGLAKNYCADAIENPEMNLYMNFQVEFVPIVNEHHYNTVYDNKTDESNELDYKGESCEGNEIDPDRNFEVNFKDNCKDNEFTGTRKLESSVANDFNGNYLANSKPIFIINIQGLGSNIYIGPAKTAPNLTEAEEYTYDLLVTGEYDSMYNNKKTRTTGRMVDSAMKEGIYTVIYNTFPKTTIDMDKLDTTFKIKYTDIFEGINYALRTPLLDLRKPKENFKPTSDNPSTITFYLYITNFYPFSIKGKLTLDLKIDDTSSTKELTYESIEATTKYLYPDSSEEDFESFVESEDSDYDTDNGFYEIILENLEFNPQSEVKFKIKFERKISGQLAYTAQILLEPVGYTEVFQQIELTYAETSDDPEKKSKYGVLLLMLLVFSLIIATIVCLILSKQNKYNRLFL